jgi:hypothetical protein
MAEGDIKIMVMDVGLITIHADGLCFMGQKGRNNAFAIRPRLPGESMWRVMQRAIETLARADEIGEFETKSERSDG